MIKKLKLILKMWYFMDGYVYKSALLAVKEIGKNIPAQKLGENEGMPTFCPRCGQIPMRDVRHDEAFELAFEKLNPPRRSCDLHFGIELARWLR